jgi:uncharacterized DUF497 family protein
MRCEWDPVKDQENQAKHGVTFTTAQLAFLDPHRVIAEDLSHSGAERRYFCFGRVGGGGALGAVHVPQRRDPNLRGRLLAEREADL